MKTNEIFLHRVTLGSLFGGLGVKETFRHNVALQHVVVLKLKVVNSLSN